MSDHTTALPRTQQVNRQRPWPVIVALVAWTATTIALTMLKAFYRIGYLWDPAVHRHRGLHLNPFEGKYNSIFGWVFDWVGNVVLFGPIGFLIVMAAAGVYQSGVAGGGRWAAVWLIIAASAVFAVLVGLGESLGDPDKIVG